MPEFDSKYLNNYLNGISYENAFWKTKYTELWHRFNYLQNENDRLKHRLHECYELNHVDHENHSNYNDNNTNENTNNTGYNTIYNNDNSEILSHLQNKNNELLKTIMDKSKEIYFLQGELEKHKLNK